MILRRCGVAALVVAAGGMASAIPAHAVVPACGSTITTNTTLTGDVLNCPGNGIRINASNITLDLNGHTVQGTVTTQNGPVGIFVLANRSNVTIKNGRVSGFSFGVGLGTGTSGNEVTSLILEGNGSGISSVSTVMGVNAVTSGNRVHANRMANNTFQGIGLTGSNNRIESNAIVGSPTGVRIGASGNNTPSSDNSRVTGNALVGGRVTLANSSGTLVQNNQITTNSNLTGILVSSSQGTTVMGNAVTESANGIGVDASASSTSVNGNVVYRNTNSGISVGSPTTTITGNNAFRNNNGGIRAVAGVIDGGGNKAADNGGGPQCTGVVCT